MDYVVTRGKSISRISLKVDTAGKVIVSAPSLVPGRIIDRFVHQHQNWILRQQKKLALRSSLYPIFDMSQRMVSVFGKLYYYRFNPTDDEKIVVRDKEILIRPVTGIDQDTEKTLIQWLRLQASQYICDATSSWSIKMGVTYQKISFRQQMSRWGSCSNRGSLNFNWRLVHFNTKVIDYVVIHELSHLVHHDHSPEFWKLVATFCPSYSTHRRYLVRQVLTRV
jgi:predicted metal-dependent hydrolase